MLFYSAWNESYNFQLLVFFIFVRCTSEASKKNTNKNIFYEAYNMNFSWFKTVVSTILVLGLQQGANAGIFSSSSATYAKTKYPVVLVGGFLNFDSLLGVEYFYGIGDDLQKNGATVLNANVSPYQTNEFRGEELIAQIEDYLAVTGAKKVNIIGHSQGAPTARYVAAVRPDLVASVTSVHGMNRGAPIATFIKNFAPEDSVQWAIMEGLTSGMGAIVSLLSGGPNPFEQSAEAVLKGADPDDYVRFNASYPAGMPTSDCGTKGDAKVNDVYYWSWGGVGGYFGTQTNALDLVDSFLLDYIALTFKSDVKNDGVVPLCGQYLGTAIKHSYRHNHVDAMRHLFGLMGIETDPKTIYRTHANRLKNAGL